MILFECPGMIGPLDTATLARRQIIPFLGGKGMILGFRSKKFCLWTGPQGGLHIKKHSIKNTVSSCVQKILPLQALNSVGMNLNRARIKLRERENQLSA
jgi:hypothetical protein